jgi:hypothetical protein
LLTFRAYAKDVTEGKVVRTLNVIDAPSFALSLASSSVALIGGGSAAITVNIARVNLPAGIDLSLDAPTGITASFAAKPATGTSTGATIAVSSSMAAGTYSGTIRGRLSGFPDQTTPLSIVVLPDRI